MALQTFLTRLLKFTILGIIGVLFAVVISKMKISTLKIPELKSFEPKAPVTKVKIKTDTNIRSGLHFH